jgi:hypothetical protein
LFLRYFAHELKFSSCSLPSGCRLEALEEVGDDSFFNMCEDRDLANSPPKREVNGVRISSASSSSSSSPPPSPIVAELLLFARRAFLSLRAAYLDRPLGYWSSPEILLEADSSGVGSFCSEVRAPLVRDLAR